MKPVIRSRYSEMEKVHFACEGESLTKQSFKDECDINVILAKYTKTGVLPDLIKQNPQYGDFSTAEDYQTSLNKVIFAETQFNSLSSRVRDRFHNDPVEFLNFVHDEKNLKEMKELGLLKNDDLNDETIIPQNISTTPKTETPTT